MNLFSGSERATVHQTVPVYIPLLLPLTIIAVPVADFFLAIVRRTWRGQSPFAADRGHLHHRLLEIGHSHSRAVLIMYFWSALIAFGGVAFSMSSGPWAVISVLAVLAIVGVVLSAAPHVGRAMAAKPVPPTETRRTTKIPPVIDIDPSVPMRDLPRAVDRR
jgi:UDP-GlcNAc:undecaprenyl-phosphate GlcNAc-1-phosphate transferase